MQIADDHELAEWTAALHQGLLMDLIAHIVERDSPRPRRVRLQEALTVAFLAGREPRLEVAPRGFAGDTAPALVRFARAVAAVYGPTSDAFAGVLARTDELEGLLGEAEANLDPGLTIPLLVRATGLGRAARACEVVH